MEDIVRQRVIEVLNGKGYSKLAYSKAIGMEQTTFNNQMLGKRGISLDLIVKSLQAFPDLSAEWLLRGEGSMIKKELESYDASAIKSYYELLLDARDKRIRELEKEVMELRLMKNVG